MVERCFCPFTSCTLQLPFNSSLAIPLGTACFSPLFPLRGSPACHSSVFIFLSAPDTHRLGPSYSILLSVCVLRLHAVRDLCINTLPVVRNQPCLLFVSACSVSFCLWKVWTISRMCLCSPGVTGTVGGKERFVLTPLTG